MIRILIVDDSDTEAALIQHIIEPESDMTVVGVAKNGQEGVDLAARLKPDLITMDIEMPIMNGLEATRTIVEQTPAPIVVISSTVTDESIKATFYILAAGALTAIAKPTNILAPSFEETRQRIVDTLRHTAKIKVVKQESATTSVSQESDKTVFDKSVESQSRNYELIAIGASIGGPLALKAIFSTLDPNFPTPIVVVQHISFGFTNGFIKWLGDNVPLQVKSATDLEKLEKGTIYVAPEGFHLEIDRLENKLIARLVPGDPVNGSCPSINVMLKSVAKTCGENAIGILLTGVENDGAQGLLDLKKVHGHTLIQDPESAMIIGVASATKPLSTVVFGNAGAAELLEAVDLELKLDDFADYLRKITSASSIKN